MAVVIGQAPCMSQPAMITDNPWKNGSVFECGKMYFANLPHHYRENDKQSMSLWGLRRAMESGNEISPRWCRPWKPTIIMAVKRRLSYDRCEWVETSIYDSCE